MTVTAEIARELKDSLEELQNAYDTNKAGMWAPHATDLNVEQLKDALSVFFVREGIPQVILLAYKEYSDTKKKIVRSLTREQIDTSIQEEPPVTWEVEEIAKEFCKVHGLIPDLIRCLNQAETIFSHIQSLVAEYDCFHADDYEEEGHIVIRIEVASDQETAFDQYDTLNDWMLENISDDNLDFFVLTVRRTE